ncbi:response regulator [Myxococcota bacterium]|nr:response regulator [Myxococcota bacterium]
MAATTGAKPRVLVVDDDATMLMSLEVLLGELYEVKTATNAAEAITAADGETSVVVLDVRLGADDGYSVAERLRAKDPELPIIFHTAYPMAMKPEELINQHHPFGYLTKDGELGKLMRLIAEAVHVRSFHAEQRRAAEALGRSDAG